MSAWSGRGEPPAELLGMRRRREPTWRRNSIGRKRSAVGDRADANPSKISAGAPKNRLNVRAPLRAASHSILSGCPMEPMPTGPPGTSHSRLHRLIWGPTELREAGELLIFACLIFTLRHGKQLLISNVLVGLDPDTLSIVGLLLASLPSFSWRPGSWVGSRDGPSPFTDSRGGKSSAGGSGWVWSLALHPLPRSCSFCGRWESFRSGSLPFTVAISGFTPCCMHCFMSSAPCGRNSIAGVTHFSRSRRGSASGLRRSAPRRILATCIISIPVKRRSRDFGRPVRVVLLPVAAPDRQSVDADRISCGLQLG